MVILLARVANWPLLSVLFQEVCFLEIFRYSAMFLATYKVSKLLIVTQVGTFGTNWGYFRHRKLGSPRSLSKKLYVQIGAGVAKELKFSGSIF